jgi:hypothetical protein
MLPFRLPGKPVEKLIVPGESEELAVSGIVSSVYAVGGGLKVSEGVALDTVIVLSLVAEA